MESGKTVLLYILVPLVVLIVAAVYGTTMGAKRKGGLTAFADQRGWAVAPADQDLGRLSAGEPFQAATPRGVRGVLRGQFQGHQAVVFDYTYVRPVDLGVVGGSKIQTSWVSALLDLPGLPRLQAAPRTGPTMSPWSYGMAALAVGDPQFDQRFEVHTDHQQWALAVLRSGLGQYLLSAPDRPWRVDGQAILTWQHGHIKTDQIDAGFLHLLAVASQVVTIPVP